MTTYWHIAHPTYTAGDDLTSRYQLVKENRAPEWQWNEADEGFDETVVCVFPDTPRGRTETDWLWYERQDSHLLRIELPEGYETTKVEEGYPAVPDRIPAEYITLIRTGYAEHTVRSKGDGY